MDRVVLGEVRGGFARAGELVDVDELELGVVVREAEREARLLRDKEQAEYVAQCAMLGFAVVAAPPLPDGATEDDRARLEREALNRFYGY